MPTLYLSSNHAQPTPDPRVNIIEFCSPTPPPLPPERIDLASYAPGERLEVARVTFEDYARRTDESATTAGRFAYVHALIKADPRTKGDRLPSGYNKEKATNRFSRFVGVRTPTTTEP